MRLIDQIVRLCVCLIDQFVRLKFGFSVGHSKAFDVLHCEIARSQESLCAALAVQAAKGDLVCR